MRGQITLQSIFNKTLRDKIMEKPVYDYVVNRLACIFCVDTLSITYQEGKKNTL